MAVFMLMGQDRLLFLAGLGKGTAKGLLCSPSICNSQHRAGQTVNFYPLGRVFANLPPPQPNYYGEMEQPDSSRLQIITGLVYRPRKQMQVKSFVTGTFKQKDTQVEPGTQLNTGQ